MTIENDSKSGGELTRREFLKYSAGTVAALSTSSLTFACVGGSTTTLRYPIDSNAATTVQRMLAFPKSVPGAGLAPKQLSRVADYAKYGYGNWTFGSGLPIVTRHLNPALDGHPPPTHTKKLLNFFAFSDIHITDKEAPNQLMYLQQSEPTAYANTSIYSPVMMYTTHVLDAAIQTANALHKVNSFDFAISLGDTCNCTSYNELRWYIDVIDGKVITPSSGANVGADTIDYQKPYQAAGLDPSIPWYQAFGNHDHFFIGSFPVDADPSIGLRNSYIAGSVWSAADILKPVGFPVLVDLRVLKDTPAYYMGHIDASTPLGTVVGTGAVTDPAYAAGAPKVVADPDRRSLTKAQWVQEYFNTTTSPVGHGFNLVDPALKGNGFGCYSFVPKSNVPLKVIVLDDTQSETDGSNDIHGHGYLDAQRWEWLKSELSRGQAANQLMIVAAHVPIGVSAIGSETEWWLNEQTTTVANQNAVSIAALVETLQTTPNLLMWIAGHRHLNVVKAFPSGDPTRPEQGFWQVETSSLRDFPQQFRTFEIHLNSDYTISIVTINVDPAVAEGTPAAASRKYAIAVQQIVQNNVNLSNQNFLTAGGKGVIPVTTMDPTRKQTDGPNQPDPTIQFVDMTHPGFAVPVPVNGSYNADLVKQLSPQMVATLKAMFP